MFRQALAEEGAQQADGAIGQQLQRDRRWAEHEHLLQQRAQIGIGGEVADEQQHDGDQADARHRQAQRQHQIARRNRPGRRYRRE